MKGGSLMFFARNRYSQNGEDGIIAEVMRRLSITVGSFVEFGAGNGRDLSNTLRLAEQGWSGVWIEGDMASCAKAAEEAQKFNGRVEVLHTMVGLEGDNSLDNILSRTNSRRDLDFMSIDIDSCDLQVWASLKQYRSKVVLIEINSSIPVGVEQVHGNGKEGASFTSMVNLATEKGYKLACHTGNLLFVDESYHKLLRLPTKEADPTSLFNDMWVQWAAGGK